MEFRVVGGCALEISGSKSEVFAQAAEYYQAEARLGEKVIAYGAGKDDVGVSYMTAARLSTEFLGTVDWSPEMIEAWLEFLAATKPPLKKDDWAMTCFLMVNMIEEGFEDITKEDIVAARKGASINH